MRRFHHINSKTDDTSHRHDNTKCHPHFSLASTTCMRGTRTWSKCLFASWDKRRKEAEDWNKEQNVVSSDEFKDMTLNLCALSQSRDQHEDRATRKRAIRGACLSQLAIYSTATWPITRGIKLWQKQHINKQVFGVWYTRLSTTNITNKALFPYKLQVPLNLSIIPHLLFIVSSFFSLKSHVSLLLFTSFPPLSLTFRTSISLCFPLFLHVLTHLHTWLAARSSHTRAFVPICFKTNVSSFKRPEIIKQKHCPSEVLVSAVQTYHHCPLTPTYTRASERSASWINSKL